MRQSLGSLREFLDGRPWPSVAFPAESPTFLDDVEILDFEVVTTGPSASASLWVGIRTELAFRLPGFVGAQVVVSGTPEVDGVAVLQVALAWGEERQLTISGVRLAIRFDADVLRPAAVEGRETPQHAEVAGTGSIRINEAFDVELIDFDGFELLPSEIGRTGLVISAEKVSLDLSVAASRSEILDAGFDASFIGVFIGLAELRLPEGFPAVLPADLALTRCAIGSGGVSGSLSASYYDAATGVYRLGESELLGVGFRLRTIDISLRQGALEEAVVSGEIRLPFFKENWIAVSIGLDLDGALTIDCDIAGIPPLEVGDFLTFDLSRLDLGVTGGSLNLDLDGLLQIKLDDVEIPGFDVRGLRIGASGEIEVPGGWLDTGDQKPIDLFGCQLEVDKVGFGKLPSREHWVGFSGALRLVEGIQASASVEGLRIKWVDGEAPSISLNGIGVELSLPDALYFKGEISLDPDTKVFAGALALYLADLGVWIDGTLVVGKLDGGDPSFALYFAIQLPSGIPLFATGLGIFGFQGLLAVNFEPSKDPKEPWYRPGDGYYQRDPPGVVQLKEKWKPASGRLALGAGASIATLSDNGYVFSGNFILVLVLPGPIVMLQGAASLLTTRRSPEESSQADFKALAVLDGRAGHFVVGLEAQYRQGLQGELIDIQAGSEAFFDFNDGDKWYINLGERSPLERRVRARLFKPLLEASAYLNLNSRELATGVWVGFGLDWGWLRLAGWLDSHSALRFRPIHFSGVVWLHGGLDIDVFGMVFGFAIDAGIRGEVSEPFYLRGNFSVSIGLPWPLDDLHVGVELEWKEPGVAPPPADPLQEIGIEHAKTGVSWLPVSELGSPARPVVPLDCRPVLTFQRPLNDFAHVDRNAADVGEAFIGDQSTRFGLIEVALDRWSGGQWVSAGYQRGKATAAGENPIFKGDDRIYGTWVDTSPPQTKLRLWARSPFEHLRRVDSFSWNEWISHRDPNFPCPAPEPPTQLCSDFAGWAEGSALLPELELEVGWLSWYPERAVVVLDGQPIQGLDRCLLFGVQVAAVGVRLRFRHPVLACQVVLGEAADGVNRRVRAEADSSEGTLLPIQDGRVLRVAGSGITSLLLSANDSQLALLQVCVEYHDPSKGEAWLERFRFGLEKWYDNEPILDPYTDYRLSVTTAASSPAYVRQFLTARYFRTEGPPGRTRLSRPAMPAKRPPPLPAKKETVDSGLRDLASYVGATAPPAKSRPGQVPVLYRPFYRAYDVAVEFNEDWVETMYQRSGDAVSLVLYDAGGRPSTDAEGRALDQSAWRRARQLGLQPREWSWLNRIDQATCTRGMVRWEQIVHDPVIAIEGAERCLLEPEYLYEARLVLGRQEGAPAPPTTADLADAEPLSRTLPSLFSFRFATSRYVSFFHHVHDYDAVVRRADLTGENLSRALALPADMVCDALVAVALGGGASRAFAPGTELIRLMQGDAVRALLVRSPEPLDPARVQIALARGDRSLELPPVHGPVVLAQVRFGRECGDVERMDLLLRERASLAGLRISQRAFGDRFAAAPESQALLRDHFAEGDLVGWRAFDLGSIGGPSAWRSASGGVLQSGAIDGSAPPGLAEERRGTQLVAGDTAWHDVAFRARLRPAPRGAIGVVFRHTDEWHYYRFSSDADASRRQLVKVNGTTTSILWTDDKAFPPDVPVEVTVLADGPELRIECEGVGVLVVQDGELPTGRCGLYCSGSPGAWFSSVEVHPVERVERDERLFLEDFSGSLERWEMGGEDGVPAPASWRILPGELVVDAPYFRWAMLGERFDGRVLAVEAGENGELFAAGEFAKVGESPASHIARWDGEQWVALDSGVNGPVYAFASSGNDVFVAGNFSVAGGRSADNIAIWNGLLGDWRPLKEGAGTTGPVHALLLQETLLWIGGDFVSLEEGLPILLNSTGRLAAWDLVGKTWARFLPEPNAAVDALVQAGPAIVVGGEFGSWRYWDWQSLGGPKQKNVSVSRLARVQGFVPRSLVGGAPNGPVTALASVDSALFVAGGFTAAGGAAAAGVAAFDGATWAGLAEGVDQPIQALAARGRWLYAGGRFSRAGRWPCRGAARWDLAAREWEPLPDIPGEELCAIAAGESVVAGGALADGGGWVAELERAGAQWAVTGDPDWSDVRLSVRLLTATRGSVGVAVGWRSPDDYLALWLDVAQGTARLVRRAGGQETLIWEGAGLAIRSTWCWVTLDAIGGRAAAYLNGVELFDIEAGDPQRGRFALLVHGGQGVRFGEVEVLEPRWIPWITLGEDEVPLPAGTRVRLRSGRPVVGPAPGPGFAERAASPPGQNGRVRLPRRAAHLRLQGPDGGILQERWFLAENSHDPLAVDLFRRPDGTALALVPRDGEAVEARVHRLTLSYARSGPGLVTFSATRDEEPEVTELDF